MTPEQIKRVEEIRDRTKRAYACYQEDDRDLFMMRVPQILRYDVPHLIEIIDSLAAENEGLRDIGSVVVAENKYEALRIFRERHERANSWNIYNPDPYSPATQASYHFIWLPTSQAKRIEEIANGPPSIEALREIERMANEESNQREDGKE